MRVTIAAAVGYGGANRKLDTRKVQRLLNAVFPAKPVPETGACDAVTVRRIKAFQRRFMANPDGRVDPGGRTLRRLNQCAPGMQPDWSGDSSRWSRAKKLASLDGDTRRKVKAVLSSLENEGFKPRIVYAWRSVAVQQELVAKGRSRVRFSFHNAQRPDGKPNAYAADIIDRRWAWGPEAETNGFWAALGTAAKREGLFWGGDWRRFKDLAHVQLYPNSKLATIKRESGLA